jgi:hypothetical protein
MKASDEGTSRLPFWEVFERWTNTLEGRRDVGRLIDTGVIPWDAPPSVLLAIFRRHSPAWVFELSEPPTEDEIMQLVRRMELFRESAMIRALDEKIARSREDAGSLGALIDRVNSKGNGRDTETPQEQDGGHDEERDEVSTLIDAFITNAFLDLPTRLQHLPREGPGSLQAYYKKHGRALRTKAKAAGLHVTWRLVRIRFGSAQHGGRRGPPSRRNRPELGANGKFLRQCCQSLKHPLSVGALVRA